MPFRSICILQSDGFKYVSYAGKMWVVQRAPLSLLNWCIGRLIHTKTCFVYWLVHYLTS